jgi:hypothetical protein
MRTVDFAFVLIATSWPMQGWAQSSMAKSPPISVVQLEKLVKVVEVKGKNITLNADVSRALKLNDGVPALIREVNTADMMTGKKYSFGLIVGSGRFLTTMSDGSSPRLFVFDQNLRILNGLKTGFGLEPMSPPDAEAGGRETLEQFSQFLELN